MRNRARETSVSVISQRAPARALKALALSAAVAALLAVSQSGAQSPPLAPLGCAPAHPSGPCPDTVSYFIITHPGAAIPDYTRQQSVSSTMYVTGSGALTSLSVSVDIEHTYRGDLVVALTSPAGTQVTLHNKQGGSADNIKETYSGVFGTMLGSQVSGNWTLSVGDYYEGDVGVLESWSIDAAYTPPRPAYPAPAAFPGNFESPASKWTETGYGSWTDTPQRAPTLAGSSPSILGAPSALGPHDAAFCPDNCVYAADRSTGAIFPNSVGTSLGTVSGTSSHQSGGSSGSVNEATRPNSAPVRQTTSLIDEPSAVIVQ